MTVAIFLMGSTQRDKITQIQNLQIRIDFLESENNRLSQIQQEKNDAVRRVADSENKVRKLTKIIIESGHGDKGPSEEEVVKGFRDLNQAIIGLVHHYYATFTVPSIILEDKSRRWRVVYRIILGPLSDAHKILWLRCVVATAIYHLLFDPDYTVFGLKNTKFNRHTEKCMRDFEYSLLDSEKGLNTLEYTLKLLRISH